MNAVGT